MSLQRELAVCRERPSVRLWEKTVSLKPAATLHRSAGALCSGAGPALPFYGPCLLPNEWMRASGLDRPCKEQGTIPDHPENGSPRTQKQAVATAPAERGWGS